MREIVRARWNRLVAVVFFCALASFAFAQQAESKKDDLGEWIRANYTKFEYRIAMRDGARLFTSVYVPKDAGEQHTYPIHV